MKIVITVAVFIVSFGSFMLLIATVFDFYYF